jgi:hypothetical protein
MSTGMGISFIVVGAILVFALTARSPHWVNLQIVGVILILAGVLGMVLPRLRRSAAYPDMLSRWVLPGQFRKAGTLDAGKDPVNEEGGPSLLVRELSPGDPPTLADDILRLEHDPPL